MKRFIVYGLVLIIGIVFCMGGCNTPDDNINPGRVATEDVVFDWGSGMKTELFGTGSDNSWQGKSFPLSGATTITGGPVGNIDLYNPIIIEADLYDRDNNLIEGTVSDLAQFSLIPQEGGDWENSKLAVGSNMSTGETSGAPLSGKTETPTHLLLEVHYWTSLPSGVTVQVGYINVRKLTFKPKVGDVVLKEIFGTSATINGNKIIFDNASYGDSASGNNWDGTAGKGSAVLLLFPASAGTGDNLKNKTIKVNFTIEPHTCKNLSTPVPTEHQLNVQAAQDTPEKDMFNGQDPSSHSGKGQKYITLDSADETGYNTATGTGTFTIPANDLIAASEVTISSGNDGKAPFTLDSVRLTNNGTKWDESKDGTTISHYRCKTYTLVINSIVIE
jgi:hypothetical protein